MLENNKIPELTLELSPSPAAPAVPAPVEEVKKEAAPAEIILTPEEEKIVAEFLPKINVKDSNLVLQYGAGSQQKIADFSQNILNNVRTKDLGEVGTALSTVVTELKSFDVQEEEKGFFSFFKKSANKITALQAKYDQAEDNVNIICNVLEGHQIQLMKDTAMLDQRTFHVHYCRQTQTGRSSCR